MNIIVCIKQTPDTERNAPDYVKDTWRVDRSTCDRVANVFDTYALEVASRLKDMVPDSSLTAQTYCFFRLGARWVHYSNKPTKGEIFFQTGPILRQFGDIPEGYPQHPQRLRSHCLILSQQFCFFPSSKRKISSFHPDMTA